MQITRIGIDKVDEFFKLYHSLTQSDFEEWTTESKEMWLNEDYSLSYWKETLAKGKLPIFVAFDNHEMVGFITAESLGYGVCYIGWLGVLSEYRGQKLAFQLLSAIEAWCKENGIHKLELDTQTTKLVAFYQKQGFELEGTRKNSWQHLNNYLLGKTIKD